MSRTGRTGAKAPVRLRKRAEFLAVRQGEKRRGPLFLLEMLEHRGEAAPRVGFTVTKKNGNAAIRNRIRRRLREAVRVHAAGDMAAGTDYVVVARPDCLHAPFGAIASELKRRLAAPASTNKANARHGSKRPLGTPDAK